MLEEMVFYVALAFEGPIGHVEPTDKDILINAFDLYLGNQVKALHDISTVLPNLVEEDAAHLSLKSKLVNDCRYWGNELSLIITRWCTEIHERNEKTPLEAYGLLEVSRVDSYSKDSKAGDLNLAIP